MHMDAYTETINLVKSLSGKYKESDKQMVIDEVEKYKQKHNCSYKYAFEMMVDGNPSYSAYCVWKRQLDKKS